MVKKSVLAIVIVTALAVFLAPVEIAQAQAPTPQASFLGSGQDLTMSEFNDFMISARPDLVEQALANGEIPPAQADWMKRRGPGGRGGGRRGPGDGTGPINPFYPDCPYTTPTAP